MTTHKWLPLSDVLEHEDEMIQLEVSEVARSPRGFLTAYKRLGSRLKTHPAWAKRREAFIARHLVQYKANPTYRPFYQLVIDELPTQ